MNFDVNVLRLKDFLLFQVVEVAGCDVGLGGDEAYNNINTYWPFTLIYT